MEDPEPEQKRIRRIADYIENEIAHFPLEDLARHKAAMINVLQYLNIEEAYAVSLMSRQIFVWFQNNDIWYALAKRWLTSARLAQCEAWVEQVKPQGKRINYLWLLIAEFVHKTFSDTFEHVPKFKIELAKRGFGGYVRIRPYAILGRYSPNIWQVSTNAHDTSVLDLFNGAGMGEHAIFEYDMLERLFKGVYRIFVEFPKARITFQDDDWMPLYIRSKLTSN